MLERLAAKKRLYDARESSLLRLSFTSTGIFMAGAILTVVVLVMIGDRWGEVDSRTLCTEPRVTL